jgi:hypothetical protein
MPALLLALGSAISWLGRHVLTLFAGELFRKVVMFLSFNVIMAFVVETLSKNMFGISVFDAGNQIAGAIASLPQFAQFLLTEWGLLSYVYTVLTAMIVKFFYRRTFGAMGGR